MRRWQHLVVAGTAVLGLGAMAVEGMAREEVDAGDLPATAMALGAVTGVEGTLASTTDADLYVVCAGEDGLLASTVGGTTIDTVLHAFDADGRALASNDDTSGTWQSEVSLAAPGQYLIGITAFGQWPVTTDGRVMFQRDAPVSGDGVLGGWAGSHPATGAYRMTLTGAVECAPPVDEGPQVAPLDVHPGSEDPTVNSRSRGRTPMALLSVPGIDTGALAGATIEVGPAGATPAKVQVTDMDGDGTTDLLVHVRTAELGLEPGEHDLCLTATPEDGPAVRGCETIRVR